MEIAICKNSQGVIAWVQSVLRGYPSTRKEGYDLRVFGSVEELASALHAGYRPALTFLGFTAEESGVTVNDIIRGMDPHGAIIFIPSGVNAKGQANADEIRAFMLTPMRLKGFDSLLGHLEMINGLEDAHDMKLAVSIRGSQVEISCPDLAYIESRKHDVIFHTQNSFMKAIGKLGEYEELLKNNKAFLRCHQSFIVNMDHIQLAKGTKFILRNGEEIPIRRKDAAAFKAKYLSHRLGK